MEAFSEASLSSFAAGLESGGSEEISSGDLAGIVDTRDCSRDWPSTLDSEPRDRPKHAFAVQVSGPRSHRRAWGRAPWPKECHLARNPRLAVWWPEKLQLDWSPQQISGWLERQFGNDESMRVSHETIYRSPFVQARGVLKKQLTSVYHSSRSYGVRRGRNYRARNRQGRGHDQGRSVDPRAAGRR